jgi:hypothetical protein
MNELELRQLFKNLSDCYANTGRFENDGSYTEGEVVQAMTEDRFIEALNQALRIHDVVWRSKQLLEEQSNWLMANTSLEVEKIVDFKEHFK